MGYFSWDLGISTGGNLMADDPMAGVEYVEWLIRRGAPPQPFPSSKSTFENTYNIAMDRPIHHFEGETSLNGPFSIAMLDYQRVWGKKRKSKVQQK